MIPKTTMPARPLSKPASVSVGSEPRLIVELVPSQCWGVNLHEILSRTDWDKLRRTCYDLAGNKCELCGGVGRRHPVEAHEVWAYDEQTHTQSLQRLIALCPSCHEVKHIGRAFAVGFGQRALSHLAMVNGWTKQKALEHKNAAMVQWKERSSHAWTTDLSWLEGKGVTIPPRGN